MFRLVQCMTLAHLSKKILNQKKFSENPLSNIFKSTTQLCSSYTRDPHLHIYEPDYIDHLKPEIPLYDEVTIQIKGYDYPVVEAYQKFVHRIAKSLDIDGDDSWAVPAQKFEITRVEPNSSVVDSTYSLNIYERDVQIADVPANIMPIFLEVIQAGLPEGVNIEVEHHTKELEEKKYIPDLELRDLEIKLEEMGGPREIKPIKRK